MTATGTIRNEEPLAGWTRDEPLRHPSRPTPEAHQNSLSPAQMLGAGDGDRTRMASLEGWSSTIELHPRWVRHASSGA